MIAGPLIISRLCRDALPRCQKATRHAQSAHVLTNTVEIGLSADQARAKQGLPVPKDLNPGLNE